MKKLKTNRLKFYRLFGAFEVTEVGGFFNQEHRIKITYVPYAWVIKFKKLLNWF